jgi:hypothetical protein
MKTSVACSVLACVALLGAGAFARSHEEEQDPLCQMLFEEYVIGHYVNADTRIAAAHIVAERGRHPGFWRDVLRELREGDEWTARGCVLVLGKMLEHDATARDMIREQARTGEVFQMVPEILLGKEVVDELLARASKADRHGMDTFVTPLVRARVPEARALFRKVLEDFTEDHDASTRFHAAVGLAQLGDPAGYRWLLDHSSDPTPTVSNAAPARIPSLNLDVCCIAALRDLSGKEAMRTRQDCETRWRMEGEAAPPSRAVRLVEMMW